MFYRIYYFRYIVHILSGELRYACLTACQESQIIASEVASWAHDYLERVRSIYRELPILADLSRDLMHISADDLSKPLRKMMVHIIKFLKSSQKEYFFL